MTIEELNRLPTPDAEAQLKACCGSTRWVREVSGKRPFENIAALVFTANRVWHSLDVSDWLEAFAVHPEIGQRSAGGWSAQEQSGMNAAGAAQRERLDRLNREYRAQFGFTFLICATGRSA